MVWYSKVRYDLVLFRYVAAIVRYMVQCGTVQYGKLMYVIYRVRLGMVRYGMQGPSTARCSKVYGG